MVPPIAAADLPPTVGVGPDVLEKGDIQQEKDERRAESDAGRARDALDGAARVQIPGNNVTGASASRSSTASATVSTGPARKREASEMIRTATASNSPSSTAPRTMKGTSVRS